MSLAPGDAVRFPRGDHAGLRIVQGVWAAGPIVRCAPYRRDRRDSVWPPERRLHARRRRHEMSPSTPSAASVRPATEGGTCCARRSRSRPPATRLSVAHRQLVDRAAGSAPRDPADRGCRRALIVDDRPRDLYAGRIHRIARGRRDGDGDRAGPSPRRHDAAARRPSRPDRAPSRAGRRRPSRRQAGLAGADLRQDRPAGRGAATASASTPNGLAEMARRVRSGDPDNLEAQGAQRYWPLLFGKDFRRDRVADGVNALLNYGYAVVRAAAARAVVASGPHPVARRLSQEPRQSVLPRRRPA